MLKTKNLIVKKRENSRRYMQILTKNEGESRRFKEQNTKEGDSRRNGNSVHENYHY